MQRYKVRMKIYPLAQVALLTCVDHVAHAWCPFAHVALVVHVTLLSMLPC